MLRSDPRGKIYRVIGFVDDDPRKRGTRLRGINVLGTTRRIPQLVRDHSVSVLIYTIHNIDPFAQEKLLHVCRSTPARLVKMPDIVAALHADLAVGPLVSLGERAKTAGEARKWRALG
jgi:FlaA1/EpsC-like NDP-sugar epimerase